MTRARYSLRISARAPASSERVYARVRALDVKRRGRANAKIYLQCENARELRSRRSPPHSPLVSDAAACERHALATARAQIVGRSRAVIGERPASLARSRARRHSSHTLWRNSGDNRRIAKRPLSPRVQLCKRARAHASVGSFIQTNSQARALIELGFVDVGRLLECFRDLRLVVAEIVGRLSLRRRRRCGGGRYNGGWRCGGGRRRRCGGSGRRRRARLRCVG